ncbi:M1 family metallopeptidase [Tsuneonella mangrovi]|uniref:M1 family metallopeptidase n=1 Tax=Tsuneonella mangrovi TaxID=1982042 RepID=UPI001F0A3939|nr:M1 family metallopeptidase [Tsuneonella mangrovi]
MIAATLLAGAVLFQPASVWAADADTADTAVVALAPVPHGKLSDAVVPSAYRIDTSFDPSKDGFSGHTDIDVTIAKPTTFIDLNGRHLTMSKVTATVDGKTYTGTWHDLDPTGVARVVFDGELPAGKATLSFAYTGRYQGNASGLFHAQIGGKWYGWSQFESIDARAAFPGFDQPGYKVPFTLTIRTPPGETAVSNAPEVSNTLEDGWQVHRFAPTLPLPTYLVAMMSGPFAVLKGEVPPTPERSEPLPLRIVTPQTNAENMQFALDNTKPIVAHLEAYFGQAFPFPKLDQITSPLMGGAMENAGADLYNDNIIILDKNAPVRQQQVFGMVVAHELSHQWFGDMVTPTWWDDIWLNESFANWMGFTIGGEWRPDLKIGEGALAEGFGAMDTDELTVGRPIHQAINTNDQVDSAFDTITYGKGGHVVSMIAAFLGKNNFRDGVRKYMAAHRYGNATSTDFFSAMAKQAGDPRITQAMQSFTDQQGVPLITVAGSNGQYTVSQSRYRAIGVESDPETWGVPVCMRHGDNRECHLLNDKSMAFALPGSGALMPNAGGTGYYRFELPKAEWNELIASADTLGSAEALATADSLDASFRAGRASVAQVFALAEKLAKNPDPFAYGTAFSGLGWMQSSGVLDEAEEGKLRNWMGSIARQDLAKLGFDPRAGAYVKENPDVQQRRQRMVGRLVFAHDKEIDAKLVAAAKAYLGGDKAALDPSYLSDALDAYIQAGGLPAAKDLAERAVASDDPMFRPAAGGAIADSGNKDIANWALNDFNDPRMRETEKLFLKLGIARNEKTRDIGYEWLTKNLAGMLKGTSGIFLARGVPSVLGGFCSAEKADEIAATFRPVFANTPGALTLERTIERIRNCAALKEARGAEVKAAVDKLD